MKTLILILVAPLIFNNCSVESNEEIPKLTLKDDAYIKIIADISLDSILISTFYSSSSPRQSCFTRKFIKKENGAYYTNYRTIRPDFVNVTIQDSSFYAYVIPKDTLTIKVIANSNLNGTSSISFKIDDPICAYLQKESIDFGSLYFLSPIVEQYYNSKPKSQKDFEKALQIIDAAKNVRLAFLQKNGNDLPDWFKNTQKWDYIYLSASLKYYQNFYLSNENLMGVFPSVNVEICNPEAILSSYYYNFLKDYYVLPYLNNNITLTGPSRAIYLYNMASKKIEATLKGEVLRYFNIYELISNYRASHTKEDIDAADKFSQSHNFDLNDSEKEFINQERSLILKTIENQNKYFSPLKSKF